VPSVRHSLVLIISPVQPRSWASICRPPFQSNPTAVRTPPFQLPPLTTRGHTRTAPHYTSACICQGLCANQIVQMQIPPPPDLNYQCLPPQMSHWSSLRQCRLRLMHNVRPRDPPRRAPSLPQPLSARDPLWYPPLTTLECARATSAARSAAKGVYSIALPTDGFHTPRLFQVGIRPSPGASVLSLLSPAPAWPSPSVSFPICI
jgi:hypothetical protein